MDRHKIGNGRILRAAILAGVLAGSVDIGAAALINRISPTLVLQAIASGLLGLSAYKAQWTIALGFALQMAMSIVIGGIYAKAAELISFLRHRPIPAGLAYGVAVFCVMNFIVVPMSSFGPRPSHVTLEGILLNFAAMLLFGVLIALPVSRTLVPRPIS